MSQLKAQDAITLHTIQNPHFSSSNNVDVEIGSVSHSLNTEDKPLTPQPTNDPLDPLNWSALRKYSIVGVVCFGYFMMIYAVTAPIPSFVDLQTQFGSSYTQVLWTFAIANLGVSLGPLAFSATADIIGRRTIMILGTVLSLIASGCTSIRGISIGGYMTARFFQASGATPAITVGLSIINDLSWEHERGFRVGLWVMAIDIGSYVGPLFGSFMATKGQYWVAYHITILFAVLLVLEIVLIPETLYPRQAVINISKDEDAQELPFKRTTQLPFLNFSKVPGIRHPKPWATLVGFLRTFSCPTISIPVIAYSFSLYWWIISVVTMVPVAYADFSLIKQGLLFLGLIVGTIAAELFISGRLSDLIVLKISARNGGHRTPEMRLWLGYLGTLLFAAGLGIWGASVDKMYHIMIGQLGLFTVGAGLQITNMVITTYIVDNCPDAAMDIITFYSVFINMASFATSWFINDWVVVQGFFLSFGIQALVSVGVMIPLFALLHKFGPALRNFRPMKPSIVIS